MKKPWENQRNRHHHCHWHCHYYYHCQDEIKLTEKINIYFTRCRKSKNLEQA